MRISVNQQNVNYGEKGGIKQGQKGEISSTFAMASVVRFMFTLALQVPRSVPLIVSFEPQLY